MTTTTKEDIIAELTELKDEIRTLDARLMALEIARIKYEDSH